MALTRLFLRKTSVIDMSLLRGMPLKVVECEFRPDRDTAILRSIKTLETINGKPAAQFWKEVGAGVAAIPPLDDAWLKQVAALPAKEQLEAVKAELMKRNPGFDGKFVLHRIEGNVVSLLYFGHDAVTDLSPVRALTGLRQLSCEKCRNVADLSPLKGMQLTELNCARTQVADLSPLKDMKLLSTVIIEGTEVSDLSPLKDMKLLSTVNIGGTKVSDLSPLKDMQLTSFTCSKTLVTDLSPLKDMKLKKLALKFTRIADLSLLKGMPLTDLDLDKTQVVDLSPLKGMETLKVLIIRFTNAADLSPLKDLKLTVLDACGCTQVADLSPLKKMKLTHLNIVSTTVSDLSPLKGMPLKAIDCNFLAGRDAEILRSIKTLEAINGKAAAAFWKEVGQKTP